MTRREFSVALAGVVASPALVPVCLPVVILKAIAGVRLPEILTITTKFPEEMRGGLLELRTYQASGSRMGALAGEFSSIFSRAGICPLSQEIIGAGLTYLIPFENLTARDRAWTGVNADPEWASACLHFQSYQFALYEVV